MEPTPTLTGLSEVRPSVLGIEKDEGPNLRIAHLLKEQSVMNLNKTLLEKSTHLSEYLRHTINVVFVSELATVCDGINTAHIL